MKNSYFSVFISCICQILSLQLATVLKKIGLSNSSVPVLNLTVSVSRLQVHVSVPGGVGIYIHMGAQVDTDNLTTYHILEHL